MSDSVRPRRQQPTRLPRPWDSPDKNTGVGCHFLLQCMKVKSEREVTQLCPTLRDPIDCSLPGSSIHGIFQARVLEWGAIAFSALCYSCVQISCSFYTSNIWEENVPWNKLLEASLRVLFLRSVSRVLPARTLEPSRRCALLTIRSFILLLTILSFKVFPYLDCSPAIRSTAGTLARKSQANTK